MNANDVLQRWLALEHEAVWFYAEIGGRFDTLAGAARTAYGAHIGMRDILLTRLRAAGAHPAGSELAYGVGKLRTPTDARTFAQGLESRIAAACLSLVGVVEGDDRTFATKELRRAALAELTWGGRASAFPGLPA